MTDFKHYSPPSSTEVPIQHNKKYHVFLSFRGPDVRKTLVDHLFHSLSTAGLHVFLETEKLVKGENIEDNLTNAIQDSTIYLPIFSPDYYSSVWCLKELSLMRASKSTIISLFNNVEPSDVRYPDNEKSPYAEALKMHNKKGRHSPEEMNKWKEALHQVSLLSGWSLKYTANGFEGRLVKRVVMDLVKALNIGCLYVAKYPVGLETRKEEVIELLKIGKDGPRIVGIWGMGGLGKTTLSKVVYNEIRHLFEASCFVSDIRATARESVEGLIKLQTQILKGLVKNVPVEINSVDEGKNTMRTLLTSVRVLVVLDDVDDKEHIDALVGDWYGQGSRIVVTTRNKKVFKCREVRIHPMKGLDREQSLELFSWHAFMRAWPEEVYKDMSKRIVDACDGVPLSLEILGAHLYGERDLRYWREAIENITNVGEEKVYKTLKISYDALCPEEKQIFLDIACFFVTCHNQYSLEFFFRFWEVLGSKRVYTSITNLEEKSLIVKNVGFNYNSYFVNNFCNFWMHDHIRDLGLRIVDEESLNNPNDRSRLWREEDITSVMATENIMPNVRGLMWNWQCEFEKYPWKANQIDFLASMQNLEFLFCSNVRLQCPINLLPTNLKYVRLYRCVLEEDESLSQVHNTQNDGSFQNFNFLPSIGRLKFLHYLDMSGTALFHLPNEIGELLCLEELHLCGCSLRELPQSFGNLVKLKILDVVYNYLKSFPANFNQLTSLECLRAGGNDFEELPALPKALIQLDVRDCRRLKHMPNVESMHSLTSLNLDGCVLLEEMPALPKGLQNLRFSGCYNLIQLSRLEHLHSLRELHIYSCKKLVEWPSLPKGLVQLKVLLCENLQKLPNMCHMIKLEILHLPWCTSLAQLPELNCLISLRELMLNRCNNLKKLPNMCHMIKLEILHLSECSKLVELPSLPEGLVKLHVQCDNLQKLPNMCHMIKLEILHLLWCTSLTQLPELNCLISLRELILNRCNNLKKLPNMCRMIKLEILHLSECSKLVELPSLPEGLVKVHVQCDNLQKLPNMCHMIKLEILHLPWCRSLARLPQLNCLISLKELRLDYCTELEVLPFLPEGFTNLHTEGCSKLRHGHMQSEGSKELQLFPPLQEGLANLHTEGCSKLWRGHMQSKRSTYLKDLHKIIQIIEESKTQSAADEWDRASKRQKEN